VKTLPKVLLGVGAGVVLLGLTAAGSAWWLWHRFGPGFLESAKAAQQQGAREGAALDEAACVSAALDRLRANPTMSFGASVRENQRLMACLETSRLSENLSRGVPPIDASIKVGLWASERCNALGLGGPYCGALLQRVAEYCSSPERRKKEALHRGGA